jgi:hypothetical protein
MKISKKPLILKTVNYQECIYVCINKILFLFFKFSFYLNSDTPPKWKCCETEIKIVPKDCFYY